MNDLFEFMAQRDDAIGAGRQSEYDYWRGYIDAMCDTEGLDRLGRDECEAAYQAMLKVARATWPHADAVTAREP